VSAKGDVALRETRRSQGKKGGEKKKWSIMAIPVPGEGLKGQMSFPSRQRKGEKKKRKKGGVQPIQGPWSVGNRSAGSRGKKKYSRRHASLGVGKRKKKKKGKILHLSGRGGGQAGLVPGCIYEKEERSGQSGPRRKKKGASCVAVGEGKKRGRKARCVHSSCKSPLAGREGDNQATRAPEGRGKKNLSE